MSDEGMTFDECMVDAIEAIKDAMATLDLGFAYCPACNSRRYHSYNEKREGDILAAALARLEPLVSTHGKRKERP